MISNTRTSADTATSLILFLLNFSNRFSDSELIRDDIRLFSNPLDVAINQQLPTFQLELCDLQADSFLQG